MNENLVERYLIYAKFAKRAWDSGDFKTYERYTDSAAFWLIAATFGSDVARKEYYG